MSADFLYVLNNRAPGYISYGKNLMVFGIGKKYVAGKVSMIMRLY